MTANNAISPTEDLQRPGQDIPLENPLDQLATHLSGEYILAEPTLSKPLLVSLLNDHKKVLTAAYKKFSQSAQEDTPMSYAAEWLLDNFFVVQQAIRQVREDMPSGYYQQLPKLKNTVWAPYPRVYALAQEAIAASYAHLDIEQTIHFLHGFQKQVPLTMGEIWAIPTMLRLGILSRLANAFTESMSVETPAAASTATPLPDNNLVQSCIISLRMLAIQDWKIFFERVSLIEAILRHDPADVYASMDFDTRNSYRKVIEQIARGSKHVEDDVARRVIALSHEASPDSRQAHIGYYLIGDGRRQLEDEFHYHPVWPLAVRRWWLAHPTSTYLVSIGLLTCVLLFAFVSYAASNNDNGLQILGIGLLTLLPITAIVTGFINWVVTSNLPPRLLPRMDFKEGIPHDSMTMVVIPTLLMHDDDIESLLEQLEQHFLRNSDPALFFALLTDYADAPQQHMPDDESLLQRAQGGIAALNAKYGQTPDLFYLFHRQRQWNAAEGSWMGWERKRGKLMEFNHLLRGDASTSYSVQTGDLGVLPHIKYVITLDTDTILPDGGAQSLVATLAHPLNRAEYDPRTEKVVAGYSILQPRIEIKPVSVNQTRFTQIFAGEVGLDLYTHAASDVYQDLFGVGSYVGKGIYDVDILELCLANRIPENALLSHDLFEGIHARVALVTDIFLLEEYPSSYLAHSRRLHRWIRGDWQLLPWLLPRIPTGEAGKTLPNTFSSVDRWKIFDNLRRSLVAPAFLALLMAAWLGVIGGSPLFWTFVVLAALAFPLSLSLFSGLSNRSETESVNAVLNSRRVDVVRWALALTFLPYEAFLTLNAIGITLVRLFITRKQLLQWTTAAQTARFFGAVSGAQAVWREMIFIPTLAGLFGLVLLVVNPSLFFFALPILILWFMSPQIAYWISLPNVRSDAVLSDKQEEALRHLARQTWLFFEQVVGPEDHWLPPDHFQDSPRLIAHRTSPTNIGLLLTSTLAAYDLGYIGQLDLSTRLQATFDSIDKLEHYQGHLLNWYNTLTLASLSPRYVSTVDSGNLAGCLIVVEQACLNLPQALAIRPQSWQGLLDTLGLLEESLAGLYKQRPDIQVEHLRTYVLSLRQTIDVIIEAPDQWAALIAWLNEEAWNTLSGLIIAVLELDLSSLNPEMLGGLRITSERFHHHLMTIRRDIDLLLPWLASLNQTPTLFAQTDLDPAAAASWQNLLTSVPASPRLCDITAICEAVEPALHDLQTQLQAAKGSASQIEEAQAWCRQLTAKLKTTRTQVRMLLDGYQHLAAQAERHFQAMNFSFLFNRQRKVFHIGYNLASDRLDDNYYDLLASEARLASLLAIAKRDVTPSHWMHLGRPITQVGSTHVLLSWSGTMFEYLMPTLFMESYEQTFLTQSCEAAVDNQIAYGHEKNVPWGISESSYYAFDNGMTYQYHAFGVPDLGLKRGLTEDLVIAPYASLLALRIRPQAVRENMDRLDAIQMRGLYGFYESVDYTPTRLPLRQDHAVIRSYMAHHQGMILISLTNYLLHDTMIQRFHADPRVKSFSLLLQEKIPTQAPVEYPHPEEVVSHSIAQAQITIAPWTVPAETTVPQVHVLSNGRYSTMITNAGSGYSQWQSMGLTRWEADTTLDASGSWIYIQDQDSGATWSAAYQPIGTAPEQQVTFHSHQAEFQRRDHRVTLNMQVTVAPDDDVEIRHITLVNHSAEIRHLRLTSYAEVLLAPQGERHPAFSKLFVESEYLPENNMLLFHRRPRSADEVPVYLGHFLIAPQGTPSTGAYEADRMAFVGRGRTTRDPAALQENQTLSGTIGITLDPIMALSQDIELKPYGRTQLSYLTLIAPSRQKAITLADRYRGWSMIDQAFETARRQTEIALRQLELGTPELSLMQQILSLLLYPQAGLRATAEVLNANTKGQSTLWAYAISGDLPILLLRIGDVAELPLVTELLHAHTYWRSQQVMIDLVILNLRDSSYSQELQTQLHRLITRANSSQWLNQRGGIFVINADQMGHEAQTLLQTTARVLLDGAKGSIAPQLPAITARRVPLPTFIPPFSKAETWEATPPLPRPTDLAFDNGTGGFSADGKDYVIYLEAGQSTPAPWVNVIANERFGFLVSESGASYTWSENSSENRLTPWRNDSVTDTPGEALYLRDEETGHIWSPMPLPTRDAEPYLIRHGAGYSSFGHHSQGLKQQTLLLAAPDAPVKIIKLYLENTWNRPRRVTVTYYAEWVLGVSRTASQPYIISEYDHGSNSLLARNAYNPEFGERVAFLAASKSLHGLTADRTEFLGRMGDVGHPAALSRIGLASTVEPGLDPCAAIQIHVDLPIGASEEVFFFLGQGANRDEALRLIHTYQDAGRVEDARLAIHHFWDETLGTVNVQTPDPAMNIMLNRWLLYQALACRIWGRTGFYQSSGAFGFRDQLQDVMALLLAKPAFARAHILEAARHQFEEGDVLHWWHPPLGRGVRTRFSDDLLWLPYVVAHYIETTGDTGILDETIPFLRGAPLKPEEEERYGQYDTSLENASLYDHCLRAIKRGSTSGAHGLPLMGTGDWNDGMNRVGMHGRGESVWVGWFLYSVLTKFAPLCEQRGTSSQADLYRQQADRLKAALEAEAWDGKWYRRAYYDDGTPLGSAQNLECQIDAIAQSWAVLSGAGNPDRAKQSMSAVAERLVDSEDQLLLLFTPPFDKTPNDPGYIKGYPPGIRENGGQYTHAAIWTVWAFAQLGEGNRAGDLFKLLNPISHSDTPAETQTYRVEPYVIAADVYSVEPYNGRGGWTWYTGSASWMYRLGIEALLGLQRKADRLLIDPCIPDHWTGYEMSYRDGDAVYNIHVHNPQGVNRGVTRITLDGQVLETHDIPLVKNSGYHEVHVELGRS